MSPVADTLEFCCVRHKQRAAASARSDFERTGDLEKKKGQGMREIQRDVQFYRL